MNDSQNAHPLVIAVENRTEQIAASLPEGVSPERFKRLAIAAIGNSKAILACNASSVIRSIEAAAQLGLEFGNHLGHVYLVPFKGEATLIIGYKGLGHLAYQSGKINLIEVEAVYKGEKFEYKQGTRGYIDHYPAIEEAPGPFIGAYCIITMKTGEQKRTWMRKDEIDRVKKSSPVWRDHYAEMAKKTVFRRAMKTAPTSVRLADAFQHEDAQSEEQEEEVSDGAFGGSGGCYKGEFERVPNEPEGQHDQQGGQ